MSTEQKHELINDLFFQVDLREHDFPIIDGDGKVLFPVHNKSGIVKDTVTKESTKGYKGLALEINDHGNVTVWKCFKNGNRREIASRV